MGAKDRIFKRRGANRDICIQFKERWHYGLLHDGINGLPSTLSTQGHLQLGECSSITNRLKACNGFRCGFPIFNVFLNALDQQHELRPTLSCLGEGQQREGDQSMLYYQPSHPSMATMQAADPSQFICPCDGPIQLQQAAAPKAPTLSGK